MRSMRLVGVVLVSATWMGFHPFNAEAATTWSANGASCVPVGAVGVHVDRGAVLAAGGSIVTLYCGMTKSTAQAPQAAFNSIEITYKGGAGGVAPFKAGTTANLVEMSKATGSERMMCGVQTTGSDVIKSQCTKCQVSNILDFDKNFYYVRIVLKSGPAVAHGQTVYGTSLVFDCPTIAAAPSIPIPPPAPKE